MKIVVIGGNGYIGSHVVKYLVQKRHNVRVVDLNISDDFIKNNCTCLYGNVLDKSFIMGALEDAEIVYNFAAVSNVDIKREDIEKAIKVNLIGLNNILESCIEKNINRIIHASSVYAFYNKGGVYSITKRAAEDIIYYYYKNFHIKYTILRYGTIYGPSPGQGNSLLGYIKDAVADKQINYLGDGSELREYIHIEDAAKLTIKAINDNYSCENLLITGLHSYRTKDIFELIQEMTEDEININYMEVDNNYHYKVTPYYHRENLSKKLLLDEYIDIHHGLYSILKIISDK